MKKAILLILLLLLPAVGAAGWYFLGRKPPPPLPSPNIIIMLVDTLRADHVGCYGYSRNTTPFLDEFAEENVIFENAYAQASWTKPSVASLFTSLYPAAHQTEEGLMEKEGAAENAAMIDILSDDQFTLAERLKHQGYTTHGWTPNIQIQDFLGFDQGFDHYYDSRKRLTSASVINASAVETLSATPSQPYFFYLHYMDVHAPYNPPLPQDARFDYKEDFPQFDYKLNLFNEDVYKNVRGFWTVDAKKSAVLGYHVDRYDGEIAYWDSMTRRLIAWLDWMKRLDNTIVIVLSDHGEEWMDHGGLEHGFTLYQEMIHIPLIMKFPKRFGYNNLKIREPAQIIDILPTLLDAIRSPMPYWKNLQGTSLLPALERAKKKRLPGPEDKVTPNAFSRIAWGRGNKETITDMQFKLIKSKDGTNELYNLYDDPAESRNLYQRYNLRQGNAPVKDELAELDLRSFEQRLTRRDIENEHFISQMGTNKVRVVPDKEWIETNKSIGYTQGAGQYPPPSAVTPSPTHTPQIP